MNTQFADIRSGRFARSFFALFLGMFVLFTAADAFAAGKVIWKSTTIKERVKREAWHLDMQIHLSKAPEIAHKSMKFEFTQISEFERALVDGSDKPQTRTIPLTNQQALIETVTVGFMDPGSGQIQTRTRFSFKVTRAHGYRAGRWKVKIRDTDSGRQIGHVATITLNGENEVIDRRSIVFQGKKKEEKEEVEEEEPQAQPAASNEPEEMEYLPEDDEGDVPPSVEGQPGGGCHAAGPLGHGEGMWLLLGFGLGFGALIWARRRA